MLIILMDEIGEAFFPYINETEHILTCYIDYNEH
jgi:hypothetical protein